MITILFYNTTIRIQRFLQQRHKLWSLVLPHSGTESGSTTLVGGATSVM